MRACRSASGACPGSAPAEAALLEALAARGYQEAITLAFVDPALQRGCSPSSRR